MKIKIYPASKLCHAEMWRNLQREWATIAEFTARWPLYHVGNIPDTQYFAKAFWIQDQEDVASSDVVLVYSELTDNLRGALIEAGMAIALGKFVIVVGENADYGTWQHHPQVYRVPTMNDAKTLIICMGARL